MVNPIGKIKFGIKENNLKWTMTHKYKVPDQMSHPNKTSIEMITNIFRYIPREYWYDTIKPLIWDLNINENGMSILYSDKDNYPFSYTEDNISWLGFNIEDLKRKKFNIEPLRYYEYKGNTGGVCISFSYIPLDIRKDNSPNKDKLSHDRAYFGSVVDYFGIAKDGYTFSWEGGHYYIGDQESFYNRFSPIKYAPKEGEFLYYMEKLVKKELTLKNDDYDSNIYGATSNDKFILGDTSKRKYLESFFNEYS